MTSKGDLQKLSTQALLELKQTLVQANAILITRLADRLNQVVSARIGERVSVFWEDIGLLDSYNVVVTGIRLFSVGDEVEEDGVTIEITEENVSTIAQRVRLILPSDVLDMLEQPDINISEILEEMAKVEASGYDRFDELASAVEQAITTTTQSPAPSTDSWLFKHFETTKTRH
jgi:hypothetical protein